MLPRTPPPSPPPAPLLVVMQVPMSVPEAFAMVQALLHAHAAAAGTGERTRLQRYCPHIGTVFRKLDLVAAMHEFNALTRFLDRRFVPPTFADVGGRRGRWAVGALPPPPPPPLPRLRLHAPLPDARRRSARSSTWPPYGR
jgi:hypothetical protein